MKHSSARQYQRIEQAINFITSNAQQQPDLEAMAAAASMSPTHFQKLFSQWAGVSPKKFLQFITLQYSKTLLKGRRPLTEVALDVGLSGSSRLHDLYIQIEAMTPAQYRGGGQGLVIRHSFQCSPFGQVIIASTGTGICHLAFEDSRKEALSHLRSRFPGAEHSEERQDIHIRASAALFRQADAGPPLKLHLAGTPFQLKVWEALLQIPYGARSTYSDVAAYSGHPGASRAAGSAIARNPVAVLIPCHRVIRTSGETGNYMWGAARKQAILGHEAAQAEEMEEVHGSV